MRIASELSTRVATAVALATTFVALNVASAYWCWAHWVLLAAGALLALGIAVELGSMWRHRGVPTRRSVAFATLLAAPSLFYVAVLAQRGVCGEPNGAQPQLALLFILASGGLWAALLLQLLYARTDRKELDAHLVDLLLGWWFLVLGVLSLLALAVLEFHARNLAWLVLVVAANDIAAYFVGTALGGAKLAPAFSPKKTVVGALSGVIAGATVGVAAFWLLPEVPRWETCLLLGALIAVAGQAGDLCESVMKRRCGVKDSGTLFPGHGGLLDRLDAVLGAAPVLLCALALTSFTLS